MSAAEAGSPLRIFRCRTRLPWGWTAGAPGSSARTGSVTGSSTSYSTMIFPAASLAISGWSAATRATGSPAYLTTPAASTG